MLWMIHWSEVTDFNDLKMSIYDDANDEGAETISISPRREQSRGIMVDANTVGILSLLGS